MKRIKSDPKVALSLFLYFFRIAWFTFGGGYSIIAQMQKDFIEIPSRKPAHARPRRGFHGIRLTEEQLLDQTSVGRSLPGLMIANVSYLFGYSQGGVLAGAASVCGILLPPVIILSALTMVYTQFRDNEYVARALVGVRSAVVPIIAVAVLKLRKGAFEDGAFSYIMCVSALAISLFTGLNILLIIVAAAAIGVAYTEVKRRGIS